MAVSGADRHVALRGDVLPAALQNGRAQEWSRLSERDRKLVTPEALDRWTTDLAEDDYTLQDIALLERRRQAAIRTMRAGAELTDLEFRLVRYLQRHEGKTMTYVQIARHLWATPTSPITAQMMANQHGYASPFVGHIQVLMVMIRKKLEIDPLRPQHFATVRGVGYRFYSAPPDLDDGEDYQRRAAESEKQRQQMQREFGIIEPSPFAPVDQDGERYTTRVTPGPEFPAQRLSLRPADEVRQNEEETTL